MFARGVSLHKLHMQSDNQFIINRMKKFLYFFATAAALLAFASCGEDPTGDPTPEVPAQIEVTLTNLVKGDIVAGEINKLPVTASADGVELELTFYTDKIYLPAGSYSIGQAVGNYEGKVKTKEVEAAIKSGSITVAEDGNDGYTLTGTLRLDNEVGTLAKLSATGTLVYEFPTEYYYTVVTEADTTTYKIFDLECHQLASAAVRSAEDGTFDVLKGEALPGAPDAGTWVWIDDFGTEIYLHGKVSISTTHGRKIFKFEDNHKRTFSNCELKSSITPVLIKGATAEDDLFSAIFKADSAIAKVTSVPSPVVEGMYEVTAKLFWPDGREYISFVILTEVENFPFNEQKSNPSRIVVYDDYKNYDKETAATTYAGTKGRISPVGTCFFVASGVKTAVPTFDESQLCSLISYKEKDGMKYSRMIFMIGGTTVPANILATIAGESDKEKLSNCIGFYD